MTRLETTVSKPDPKLIKKKDREDAIAVIVHGVGLIETTKGKPYTLELKSRLDAMTDMEFYDFMLDIREGRNYVPYVAPNQIDESLQLENNLKIAKQLGVEFEEQVVLTDSATGLTYLTNEKYLVLDLPVRRQIQTGESGISVAGTKFTTDDLSDQAAGAQDVSKITSPEISGMRAREMDMTLLEFLSVRGGNLEAMNQLDQSIIETGEGSLESVLKDGTRAKISDTLSTVFTSMHIKNNI